MAQRWEQLIQLETGKIEILGRKKHQDTKRTQHMPFQVEPIQLQRLMFRSDQPATMEDDDSADSRPGIYTTLLGESETCKNLTA